MIAANDRILIVGSKGMLAHAMQTALRQRGFADIHGVDVDTCDITNPQSVETHFNQIKPALVINCAAYTNVDGAEKNPSLANAVNGAGVGNLAKACQDHRATLVHYSTDYVFEGNLRRPLKPDDPVGPKSAYGKSKLLGEQLLQKSPPERWLIIRTAWLYGPNGPNFPTAMINAARAGKPLKVVCDQFGAPTYTADLADATLNLLEHHANGVWHIANAGESNWFEFAAAIFQEFNVTPDVFQAISSSEWKAIKPDAAERPAYSVFDLAPYENLTGKPMPAWRDALYRYHLMCK